MSDRIHEFTNSGLTFPVADEGPIDGDVVVLLHGFPQTSASWAALCRRLHESGYRTVRFDQRGYTPTARPKGRFAYRISELVGDVAALIGAVGTPVHLVGHDWGAVVAWATAARHPEMLRTLVAVSVPHGRAFLRSLVSSKQALMSYYMAVFQIPLLPEALLSRAPKLVDRMLGGSGMSPAALAQVHEDVIARGSLGSAINWYRALPFSTTPYLREVSVPTTYVWSTDDVALGRRCAELCERYVTGPYRWEIIHGSHWIPEEAPDLLHRAIVGRIAGT